MEPTGRSTTGIALLVDLSFDRVIFAGAILAALGASSVLFSLL